jgi:hypothetical protein
MGNDIAAMLERTLISFCEPASNGGTANVADGLFAIARAINALAEVVKQSGSGVRVNAPSFPSTDITGACFRCGEQHDVETPCLEYRVSAVVAR